MNCLYSEVEKKKSAVKKKKSCLLTEYLRKKRNLGDIST